MEPLELKCNKCGEVKPVQGNFYKRKTGRYDTYCRSCKNKQNNERLRERYKNDENLRLYVKIQNKKYKDQKASREN